MRPPSLRSALALAAAAMLCLAPAAAPSPPVKAATNLRLAPAVGEVGGKVTLYAYLTRADNNRGLSGQEITFRASGTGGATAATETSIGVAHVEFTLERNRPGTYRVLAQFQGDQYFSRSAASSTLTLTKGPCAFTLQMNPQSAPLGKPYTLGAILVNKSGQGIRGRRIKIEIDNRYWGTRSTDATGTVAFPYTFQQPGPHTLRFLFDGDGYFNAPSPRSLTIQVK